MIQRLELDELKKGGKGRWCERDVYIRGEVVHGANPYASHKIDFCGWRMERRL